MGHVLTVYLQVTEDLGYESSHSLHQHLFPVLRLHVESGSMNEALRRRVSISEGYSRFYAALSVGAAILSVLPVYATVHEETLTIEYGSLWQMATRSPVGVIGVLLLIALIGILTVLSIRLPIAPAAPVVGAVLSSIAAITILLKPGTGIETPALAEGGLLLCACSVVAALVCLVHTIHLTIVPVDSRTGDGNG